MTRNQLSLDEIQALIDQEGEPSWSRDYSATAEYVLCRYGEDGTAPGTCYVWLSEALVGSRSIYRLEWGDNDAVDEGEEWFAAREAAERAAEQLAQKLDESPDYEDLVEQILETGYFGPSASADTIHLVCEAAAGYSCGYLLLPEGECPPSPIGCAWMTGHAWLEVPCIRLRANHDNPLFAADDLLREIQAY